MRIVYFFDKKTKELVSSEIVENDIEIPENATFIKPEPGLYQPINFDGTKWNGVSKEEFDKNNPTPVIGPTFEQIALTALAQNCSTSSQHIGTLEKSITALAQDREGDK